LQPGMAHWVRGKYTAGIGKSPNFYYLFWGAPGNKDIRSRLNGHFDPVGGPWDESL
jgi:hypothetical protein